MGAEFMFVDTYLCAGDKYPFLMISGSIISIMVMPLWLKLIKRFSKHQTWAIATLIGAAVILCQIFLKPGTQVFIPLLLIYSIYTATYSCSIVASMSMLGDTIDYDMLKTGVNRGGQYFSFLALIMKATIAFGGGAAFYLLSLFNYDPKVMVHDNASAFGMKLTCILLPPFFYIIGATLIWFFPITKKRQRIIKKRIESRAERVKRDITKAITL